MNVADDINGITVSDAARRLGVSKSRVYRLIERKRIRVVKAAGQPRRSGRFTPGGWLLDPYDVEAEAAKRWRS